ncbi:MAG: DNA replication protein DnaC [Firmicutes bacterium]|nr:DNA replication protein DnaC [Bacillota bacterium]
MRHREILSKLQAQANIGPDDLQTLLSDLLADIGPVEGVAILIGIKELRSEWEHGIVSGSCGSCGVNINERTRHIFSNIVRIYTPCECLNRTMLAKAVDRLRVLSEYSISKNRAKAGLSPMFENAALETFEHRPGTEDMVEAALAFDMTSGLFIMGSYGAGKSHIAAAICNRMLQQEYTCRYANVPETLAKIRATYDGYGSESRILDELITVNLLVLDDMGAEKPTEWVADRLYTVIDSRYRHMRPTIYTTNLNLDELAARVGERIVDRVLGSCRIVVCEAKSYRQGIQQGAGSARARRYSSRPQPRAMSRLSWSEMIGQYKDDAAALQLARKKAEDTADWELLGSMSASTRTVLKELHKKMRFDWETLSESELQLLSGRQREVATLRQKYSYKDIAKALTLTLPAVYNIYRQAVQKIWKIREQRQQNTPIGLSPQQQKLYRLCYSELRTADEAAAILGTSIQVVHKQLRRIREKDKTMKFHSGAERVQKQN